MFLSALKKFLSPKKTSPIRRRNMPAFRVESLEDRIVPTTLSVGSGHTYSTISAALAAAPANAAIDIYPGTYNETLTVSKSGITLYGEGSGVVIQPTAVSQIPLSSTVNVGGAAINITGSNVVVNGLTVDGSKANSNLWFGILVDGGTATIKNNIVENIVNPSATNVDVGIQIGTSSAEVGATTSATAKVNNNIVKAYAGAGIVVDGGQASASIQGNTITGQGTSNNGVVEYGVQVSNGATARVQSNTISENTLLGKAGAPNNPAPTSAGVFIFNDSGKNTVVALNSVTMNDDGILVQSSNGSGCNGVQIVNNDVHQNYGYAGIFILSSNNVEVSCNDVSNNLTYNGIALNYSSNVLVSSNDIYNNGVAGSGTDGIYDQNGSGNQILANNSYGNTGNGINIVSSSGDNLFNNVTWNNALSGIQDYQGTNDAVWLGDSVTNDSDGIFLYQTTGDTVVGNVLALNGGYGLHLEGAKNTFVAENLVVANGQGSIYIDSTSSGTVLINNWTSSPPIKDGSSGMNGSSNSFNCSFADADNACSGLCD
jgi:parallel beta-helix repeat protein